MSPVPRAIWSGSISFGLVNVPVKLYSAVSHKDVRFHQLHGVDGGRVRQLRVCSADGEEVPYDEIVKGYEVSPSRYVTIAPDELESLDPKAGRTIDIEEFVGLDEIDPIYYDHPYYLLPDRHAEKAYALLLDAMGEAQRVGIARFVMRTKQYLAALRPAGNVLLLSTLLYADEVVPQEELDEIPREEVVTNERELTMARQLIESLSAPFEPGKYRDDYRERVLDLIARKDAGEEVVTHVAAEGPSPVVDLMAALEASLEATRAARAAADEAAS